MEEILKDWDKNASKRIAKNFHIQIKKVLHQEVISIVGIQ